MMTNVVQLQKIAKVYAGQIFRGKAEAEGNSGVKLLQIRDIKEGLFAGGDLAWADVDCSKVSVELSGGEILLPLKGNRSVAMLYEPVDHCRVTTPNQVAIVLPYQSVHATYLLWYLNSTQGRATIDGLRSGTTVGHVGLNMLRGMEVKLPDLAAQEAISSLYLNWLEQRQVLKSLAQAGDNLVQALCSEVMGAD